MSHEIRTPLNAIVGFSDMLANEPEFSDEERQEFVDIINTNTKLLLKLVGDVLELSRIESGNLSFIFQRESVRQLLDDVYQTHSLLIQPPLQFLKDFPPEDVQVNVDPMRLTQVLYPVYDILLSPALAGAAMALSCVSVALSSLRLSSRF